jgi:outer membrane protein assembly factor BamE (lipoprotein component of BamABCDE complex)
MHRVMGVAMAGVMVFVVPASASELSQTKGETPREFTLGMVQKELRPGMSQADVAERLGSPNILTRDSEGREAWVYDRVSSEVVTSSAGLTVGGAGAGAGGSVAGALGLSAGKRSDKTRSSQKTLTVVIRFSATGAVESFTWHHSRF